MNRALPQQDTGGGVDPLAGVEAAPAPVLVPSSPETERVQPMHPPPPSPPQMINLDDSPDLPGPSRMGFGLPGVSIASDFMPLVASTRSRLLELHVEYRDTMLHLKVPDHETVSTVKTLLQEKTGVPPCQQELRGWKGNAPSPATDRRHLSELNLPKENFLFLLTPEIPPVLLNGEK